MKIFQISFLCIYIGFVEYRFSYWFNLQFLVFQDYYIGIHMNLNKKVKLIFKHYFYLLNLIKLFNFNFKF